MKHISQPENSNLCGQACVAMILGISLEKAIELVGTKGKTNLGIILKALNKKSGRSKRIKFIPACNRALITITWHNGEGKHWVLKDGSYIHDPELHPMPVSTYEKYYPEWGRVTSYYEL